MIEYIKQRKLLLYSLQILFGLIVYVILLERLVAFESISDQSSITDYQNAIWYSIITLTTVGYGDLYPATTYGRVIGYVFVFLSLGIYGLLIGKITTLLSTFEENKKLGYNGTSMEDHTVIIGWNEFSKLVTDQLHGVGKEVAIELIRFLRHDKHWTNTFFYTALIVTPKSRYPEPVFLKNGNFG